MTDKQINHKQNKATIRTFMQAHYTDERLAELLGHAQDGKLSFISCCCFIGIPTADHALRGVEGLAEYGSHYGKAIKLDGARAAELAFSRLWVDPLGNLSDARRRILIPIVRAEIRRRDRLKIAAHEDAGFARLLDDCELLALVEPMDIARSLISEMECM